MKATEIIIMIWKIVGKFLVGEKCKRYETWKGNSLFRKIGRSW